MKLPLILCLLVAAVSVTAQSTCASSISVTSGTPTLYYKPYVPPQIPPISTVWGRMVYETFFAVDCRYATVEKIDDNQPQTGFYNAITTSAVLTLTRIECIQETAIITRRDRGHSTEANQPRITEAIEARGVQKRATNQASVLAFADKMADELPPDVQGLSLRAFQYLVQVNTALFAINLYNTGFDMNGTCAVLQDPVTAARLYVASVDPVQAAHIICYAAQNGLYFNRSNAQLLSDLLAVIYSIEVKSGFTSNTTELCQTVDLTSLGYLGVDENGIRSYLCDTNTTTSAPLPIPTNSTATSYTAVGTGWTGTGAATLGTAGTVGTGFPATGTQGATAPYANSTTSGSDSDKTVAPWGSTSARSSTEPTGYGATGTGATGVGPTAALSDTYSITFPNATSITNGTLQNGGHVPPSPVSSQYYAVWTTSTTPVPNLPRY